MKRPVVLLTGGGTAGHVSVNEALIPSFHDRGYELHYIGSYDGIEKELIEKGHPEVIYHSINSGKLRRYFSMKNVTDPFLVVAGIFQALTIIRKVRPEIIFSKGGFVSVPVVLAAKMLRVPVVIHESDVTPGLANKIALPFATHIYTVFEQTLEYVPKEKATCVGSIIRPELLTGTREEGLHITGLSGDRPILVVMGGSQGSQVLNHAIRKDLPTILQKFECIHICGKDNIDSTLGNLPGYIQYEYVVDELPHLLAASDIAVSRAGSNAIFELLALQKPMLLIPLSALKSRGDQILNAAHFKSLGFAQVLNEEDLPKLSFSDELLKFLKETDEILANMSNSELSKIPAEMVDLILLNRD